MFCSKVSSTKNLNRTELVPIRTQSVPRGTEPSNLQLLKIVLYPHFVMLSERAKGKQRAVEPEDTVEDSSPTKSLIIRFTEGVPDLTVTIHEQDTVQSVRQNVSKVLEQFLVLKHNHWT